MLEKDRLETVFKMFDKDNNGSLTVEEVKRLFNVHNSDDEVIAEIIKEVDKNQDGVISLTEFKEVMLSIIHWKRISKMLGISN